MKLNILIDPEHLGHVNGSWVGGSVGSVGVGVGPSYPIEIQ